MKNPWRWSNNRVIDWTTAPSLSEITAFKVSKRSVNTLPPSRAPLFLRRCPLAPEHGRLQNEQSSIPPGRTLPCSRGDGNRSPPRTSREISLLGIWRRSRSVAAHPLLLSRVTRRTSLETEAGGQRLRCQLFMGLNHHKSRLSSYCLSRKTGPSSRRCLVMTEAPTANKSRWFRFWLPLASGEAEQRKKAAKKSCVRQRARGELGLTKGLLIAVVAAPAG